MKEQHLQSIIRNCALLKWFYLFHNLWNEYYYLHFKVNKTGSQVGEQACPRQHKQQVESTQTHLPSKLTVKTKGVPGAFERSI